jgi:xanthine dehydrogenase accessory factor
VAVATIVASRGSSPRKLGTKMIVHADGTIDFTLGGGSFEAQVIADAREALVRREPVLKQYRFVPEGQNATGMICGGEADVFIEVFAPPARLVVCGGGHIALPLVRLGKELGFRVAVLEDREELASATRFPQADEVIHAGAAFGDFGLALDTDDHVVVVTHSHETDEACLREVLGAEREPAYVGMVASRRKAKIIRERLAAAGIPAARLAAVHAPIGLDIGAETPAEIAVSILGEILAARSGRRAASLSDPSPAG